MPENKKGIPKRFVVIGFEEDKPLFVVPICESNLEGFIKLRKKAKENLEELLDDRAKTFEDLRNKIDELEQEIKVLKGED